MKIKKKCLEKIQKELKLSEKFVNEFEVKRVSKNIFLESQIEQFDCEYDFEYGGINSLDFYYFDPQTQQTETQPHLSIAKLPPLRNPQTQPPHPQTQPPHPQKQPPHPQKQPPHPQKQVAESKVEIKHKSELNEENKKQYSRLSKEKLKELLKPILEQVTRDCEVGLTFWKPEKKFLITEPVDLGAFKDDPSINVPLRNIFALIGCREPDEIRSKIEEIDDDFSLRRGLQSELTSKATEYFGGVWKHKIGIDIEISEGLQCTVNIKDEGEPNKNKFFNMDSRSQGFHQFVSLILSLSIQNYSLDMKNKLILIDEPENHLHPSGIRDMMDELLRIGENNYVFLATHSCFMIDKVNKERNFIIKKDNKQNTAYTQIQEEDDIFDDEVLSDAFGINVYKDFLPPYKLLVEGPSDKKILRKAIKEAKIKTYIGVASGYGSNIVTTASRFEYEKIETLVMLDDDYSGKESKKKIIEIGGIYSPKNVLTIRDIEPEIKSEGTIEDTLGLEFIQSILNKCWMQRFQEKTCNLKLKDDEPFIQQIKIHLQKNKTDEEMDRFLQELKTKISQEFNPSNMETNFPLLKSLVEKTEAKLKRNGEV